LILLDWILGVQTLKTGKKSVFLTKVSGSKRDSLNQPGKSFPYLTFLYGKFVDMSIDKGLLQMPGCQSYFFLCLLDI
jgi:hypothetical protein